MDELEEFHLQLLADIQSGADAGGTLLQESFFEKSVEILSEAGEIDGGVWSHHSGSWKRKLTTDKITLKKDIAVTGYGGDPRDSEGTLSLILADFQFSEGVREIGAPVIKKELAKLVEFLRASRNLDFRETIEETSDGAGLADLIATTWSRTESVKLVFVTNASTTTKVDAYSVGSVDGKDVTYNVWDLKRLRKFIEQGQAREDLSIDFENDFGGSIPILRASGGEAALESYLAVINGRQLASIYDKWGPRLLESNVRSFLQAKGNVNRGIRKTIVEAPHMFLPYNNGIAATADAVTIEQLENGLVMTSVENLQIVNGGQTTASLHSVRKIANDQLGEVFVQMKLNIVPKEQAEEIVPKISEYANSQNKVNAADFFSNHPFHVRMEEFSRRILAPANENGYQETRWFYERARGQYADARSKLSQTERKKFDAEFPRVGFFTKTDLAKYENSFQCQPNIVSLGAQKNFAKFASYIGDRWGEEGPSFDETWFRRLVAKAIVFRHTEKLVSSSDWYEGGYRANIVTYGIAKLVYDVTKSGKIIDLDRIWRLQRIPADLKGALSVACAEAQDVILNPIAGISHIGEWTKKQPCWKGLQERSLDYPDDLSDVLVLPEAARSIAKEARQESKLTSAILGEAWVVEAGPQFWQETIEWGKAKRAISPSDLVALEVCSDIPSKIPTEFQAQRALKCLDKLKGLGFTHALLETID